MGCHVDFYLLKRDTLRDKFIEFEKDYDNNISFENYLFEENIRQGRVNRKTDARIIIQKIKTNTLLLTVDELYDIRGFIYETSVGFEKYGYLPEDKRFVEKLKEFGFELMHDISHGCASLFLLSLGDSESVDYSSWNYDERDRRNLKRKEFLRELEYIILLHAKLQMNEFNNQEEEKELITYIEKLEKNELLKSIVESHLITAHEDEDLVNNSSSILLNALALSKIFECVNDDVVILSS